MEKINNVLNNPVFWFFVWYILVLSLQIIWLFLKKREQKKAKLHQLYKQLYLQIKDFVFIGSLCYEIDILCKKNNLSIEDTWLLNNHFRSQKPTFIKNRKFRIKKKNLKDLSYWWNKNNETIQKRKDFIAMLIDKTKPIKLLEYDNLVSIKIK